MKKIVLSLLIILIALVMTVSAKSMQPTSMAPDDARWLIHLDMKKFVTTQLFDLLIENKSVKIDRITNTLSEKIKIDLFKDVTGITILGMGKGEDNAVMCWEGKLDRDFILSLLKINKDYKETPYGKYTIHKWERDHCGTFVNDRLALVGGNEDTIKKVLDVIAGKKKNMNASDLMEYWKEIPRGAFLKAAAFNISELARNRQASEILKKAGMAFFMALEKNENLKLKLKLTTDTPETAQSIHQVVLGFMALAKLKQTDNASEKHMNFLKLLEHLTINVEKKVLQMELNYPSEDLVKMFSHMGGHH